MPQQGAPLSTPQQFGDYHLLEKIATGGMAEVYRARAYGLAGFRKILVIKRVLDGLARDREFVQLFIDEAKIAVHLLHVNIVQVYELGEVNGSLYMAMEHVHGLDLSRLLARVAERSGGPPLLSVSLALFVATQVLEALRFAHARTDEAGRPLQIVHCDISPQNILVSYAGEVKITDFGISRAAFQARALHDVIRGKFAYMSPEQLEGRPLDGRSDLFSLGVVLFELLTGRRLFKAATREETMARVRRAEVPSMRELQPAISADLEAFVRRALAADPDDRFRDAGAMLEELSTLMVRHGHRATHHDLAAFVAEVLEPGGYPLPEADALEPEGVAVLAAEVCPGARSTQPLASIDAAWAEWVHEAGGEVWEGSGGSLLACWRSGDLQADLRAAVSTCTELRTMSERAGYRLAAGVAPGVALIDARTGRPGDGWELAGPFYLARWMMNLSAQRGRALVTEVAAGEVAQQVKTRLLGRISILGNHSIQLYEIADPPDAGA